MTFKSLVQFCAGILFAANTVLAYSVTQINSLDGPVRCEFVDPVSGTQYALAPESTYVHTLITDGIAQVRMEQVFVNPVSKVIQATYVFPLPHQGSVHGMSYTSGGQTYKAIIKEKTEAQALFDSLKASGEAAALMLQIKPNIFSQSMANIGASETVRIEVQLSMPLTYNSGTFEFAFPTMVGERCCNSESPSIFGTVSGWNPPAKVGGPRIQFNTLIQTSFPIKNLRSPTHPLDSLGVTASLTRLQTAQLIEEESELALPNHAATFLHKSDSVLNSDFVLRFDREVAEQKSSLAAYKDSTDTSFFMLNLFPNEQASEQARKDIDVFLLVDVSGSQSGWPLTKEIETTKLILDQLTSNDRICLMEFDDYQYLAFTDTIRAATTSNITIAKKFLEGSRGGGGTELFSSIQKFVSIPNKEERTRVYIFLTDGFITNEEQVLGYLSNLSPTPSIFAFGAGNNLNRYFLDEVAQQSGGASYELTQTMNPESAVFDIFTKFTSPQLKNISISFGNMSVIDTLIPTSKSLYKGMVYRIYGKSTSTGNQTITLSGTQNGKNVSFLTSINLNESNHLSWSVPKLWAREKIAKLDRAENTGLDRKDSIIAISLQHQVLSKYTAFIAYQIESNGQRPNSGISITRPKSKNTQNIFQWKLLQVLRGNDGVYFRWNPSIDILELSAIDLQGRILFQWNNKTNGLSKEAVWNTSNAPNRIIVRIRTTQGVYKQVFSIR